VWQTDLGRWLDWSLGSTLLSEAATVSMAPSGTVRKITSALATCSHNIGVWCEIVVVAIVYTDLSLGMAKYSALKQLVRLMM
jgi:hypothetical protein